MVWYGRGTAPTVCGYTVGGGMVYVCDGEPLQAKCAIDTSLPIGDVDAPSNDDPLQTLSYGSMSRAGRLDYLRWLAAGKCDPFTNPANVALYVAGIERRIVVDGADALEQAFLLTELARLRSSYQSDTSLALRCRRLEEAVEFVAIIRGECEVGEFAPELSLPLGTMPNRLKVALAVASARSRPMPFELAAAGLLGLPLGLAPERASMAEHPRALFLELLRAQFDVTFPSGFRLVCDQAARLVLSYNNETDDGGADLAAFADSRSLPDPFLGKWGPMLRIADLALDQIQGQRETRAYRAPAAAPPSPAAPAEAATAAAADTKGWLNSLPRPVAAVALPELSNRLLGRADGAWDGDAHRAVAAALAAEGLGIEPDPADGDAALGDGIEVLVLAGKGCLDPRSASFRTAIVAATLFGQVAAVGGKRAAGIEAAWLVRATEEFALPPVDALRLAARMHRLRGQTMSDTDTAQLVSDLDIDKRGLIAKLAATAAVAGGQVDGQQLALLGELYDRLAVPKRDLYSIIQCGSAAAAVTANEPVSVAQGEPVATYAIPRPANAPKASRSRKSKVDRNKAREVRKDTEKVSLILDQVFGGEDVASSKVVPPTASTFPGLDSAHAELLGLLLKRGSWDRREFTDATVAAGLMPNGVLETLNEWAYEKFGEPIVDDADPIILQTTVIDRLGEVTNASGR